MIFLRAVAVWLLILALAILNGVLREELLLPRFPLPTAYLVSGILLSLLIIGVTLASARWLGIATMLRGVIIGMLWLGLTLIFEFGFGLWVQQRSWEELMTAYTFEDGNIWPVVLLVTLLAPIIAQRIR